MQHSMTNPFLPFLAQTIFFEEPGEPVAGEGEGDTKPAGDDTAPAPESDDTPPASDDDAGKSLLSDDDDDDDSGDAKDTPPEPIKLEDLKLPENMELPEEVSEAFLETINDPELSRTELVQKLIDMQGNMAQELMEKQLQSWNDTRTSWRDETKNLPEIGGEKLNETLADIKKGLRAAGATTEVFKVFDLTGVGDNPHMVKLLHSLTQPFLEKAAVSGDPVKVATSREERMFPSHVKE